MYSTAYQAIGALIGLGVPWNDLCPTLIDLSEAWGIEQVSLCSEYEAVYELPAENGDTLPSEPYLLYRVARTNLHALAATVPATSPVDYWLVLEILDSLYDPADRVAADSPITVVKHLLYATARAALERLAAYEFDKRLLEIRDLLDHTWLEEPDQAGGRLGVDA